MADQRIQDSPIDPDTLESAIPFRFEVTWRALILPLRPTSHVPRSPAKPDFDSALGALAEDEDREWTMVVRRLMRLRAALVLSLRLTGVEVAALFLALGVLVAQRIRRVRLPSWLRTLSARLSPGGRVTASKSWRRMVCYLTRVRASKSR